MRIRFNDSTSLFDGSYRNLVRDLPEAVAQRLIAQGVAEPADEERENAMVSPAEIATASPRRRGRPPTMRG